MVSLTQPAPAPQIVLYAYMLRRRTMWYEWQRRRVPRRYLPVTDKDMSRRIYKRSVDELVRVSAVRAQELVPEDSGDGDVCWAKATDRGVRYGTHFGRAVAKSYANVEDAALSRRPNLRMRNNRSIRDYVGELEKEFSRLPPDACDDYVRAYERARFGNHRLDYQGFVRFLDAYSRIVSTMTERKMPGSLSGRGRNTSGTNARRRKSAGTSA